MRLLEPLLDFFLPAACLGCGARMVPEESDRVWCGRCGPRLRPPPAPGCPRCQAPLGTGARREATCRECAPWPPELVGAGAAVAMKGPAHRLVHALKYDGWPEVAPALAERMVPVARGLLPRLTPGSFESSEREGEAPMGPPVTRGRPPVIPVPTTASRERERGYNQAALLARYVADALDLPLQHVLERREEGRTQVALNPSARRANVRQAFRYIGGQRSPVPGAALLVDDVLTTGATAEAAAQALAEGGIQRVALLTFARSLPEPAPGNDVAEDPEALGELLDPVLPAAWQGRADADGTRRSDAHSYPRN